jgi:hypothetical protein
VVVVTVSLSLGLGFLPYWSVYMSNETFGSTPDSDLVGLISATFGAVVGGFAVAKRIFKP